MALTDGKLHLLPCFVWRRVEQSNLSPLEKNSSGAFGCLARAIRQCSNLEKFQGFVPSVLIDLFSLFTGMLYCLPYDMAYFEKLWFYVMFFFQPSQIYKSKSAISVLYFCMEGKHWGISQSVNSRNTTSTSQPGIALIPARKKFNTSYGMCIHKYVIYMYIWIHNPGSFATMIGYFCPKKKSKWTHHFAANVPNPP